nr:SPASM domain-containing protein [Feifania hominis]
MRCSYCFYRDESEHRETASHGIMTRDTAARLIDRAAQYAGGESVHFAFQGGEPTLAGLDFFAEFCAEAVQKCGSQTHFSIQTNGLLLDESWCALLRQYRFLVGLSLDGAPGQHDRHRRLLDGGASAGAVLGAKRLLEEHRIDYNILTVVTEALSGQARDYFSFLLENRVSHVQCIPCLAPLGGGGVDALTPRGYGRFLRELFGEWFAALRAGNYVSVRLFDNVLMMLRGFAPEQCGLYGACRIQFVVEADGSVYPCDFYALDEYRMGSLDEPLEALEQSAAAARFLGGRVENPAICAGCKAFGICRGGCRRERELLHGERGYCPYQEFLYSAYPALRRIADFARMPGEQSGTERESPRETETK